MAYFRRLTGRKRWRGDTKPADPCAALDRLGHAPHQAFPAKTVNGETPRILVDEDVHVKILSYLNARNFDALRVHNVGLNTKPDLDVFNYAAAENRVLLTQDRGYIRRANDPATLFDLAAAPGVIVLPSPTVDHISRSPKTFPGMRVALEEFSLNPDLARGKVCEFTAYGQMIMHTPARPNGAPVHILQLVAKS